MRSPISICHWRYLVINDEHVYHVDMKDRTPTGCPSGPVDVIDADGVDALFDEVAGHLNAQTGRLIDLTIWLLANMQEWQGDGLWTPNQYLAWRCGVGPSMASNIVAAAGRAKELPVAIEAVRRGELSLDQLMPIVRRVPDWADEQVVSLATPLTVSQIRRLVARTDWEWRPGHPHDASIDVDPDTREDTDPADTAAADGPGVHAGEATGDDHGSDEVGGADSHDDIGIDAAMGRADGEPADDRNGDAGDEQHRTDAEPEESAGGDADENRVSYGIGADGRWYLYASLDPDLGAVVETALNEARDALHTERNGGDGGNDASGSGNVYRPVSDADGFVELAHRSLDAVLGTSRRNRYRINMYLDIDGGLTDDHGTVLPPSIAELLTCDGRIDPVFVDDAIPISVGRSQRTIPDRTRRAVLKRDGHCCQVPGCDVGRGLDLHHIVHWSRNGPTDTFNLITLCARHHRMHHQGRIGITGDADHRSSLVFSDARGRPIRASGANPTPPTGPPPPIRGVWEHPDGGRLDGRWVTFADPAIADQPRHQQPGVA